MTETDNILLVSITCSDRPGLIAAITGALHEMNINLGDCTFSVLGEGAEFTAVCEAPDDLDPEEVVEQLYMLDELENAEINVRYFSLATTQRESGNITHRVSIKGKDQPGLVARLTEVFGDYEANIVHMNTKTLSTDADREYLIELEVFMPAGRGDACLAAVGNTAAALNMSSDWVEI
jgi:glycine cleavage system transcriptional repressor